MYWLLTVCTFYSIIFMCCSLRIVCAFYTNACIKKLLKIKQCQLNRSHMPTDRKQKKILLINIYFVVLKNKLHMFHEYFTILGFFYFLVYSLSQLPRLIYSKIQSKFKSCIFYVINFYIDSPKSNYTTLQKIRKILTNIPHTLVKDTKHLTLKFVWSNI
jgi:hypothetical protein